MEENKNKDLNMTEPSCTQTYHVEGMSCAACAARVERILNKME